MVILVCPLLASQGKTEKQITVKSIVDAIRLQETKQSCYTIHLCEGYIPLHCYYMQLLKSYKP